MGSWSQEDLPDLVRGLLAVGRERGWTEFKQNNAEPASIGKYVSALANSAALVGESAGYLLWGIEDATFDPIGTTFRPHATKGKGSEDLLPWLIRQLTPRLDLSFHELDLNGRRLVLLEVPAVTTRPVRWRTEAYIRVGSYTKKLCEHPDKERALWRGFERTTFENGLALQGFDLRGLLDRMDSTSFFSLLGVPHPATPERITERLISEGLATRAITGKYAVTNLGAILFGRCLNDFPDLGRKAVRVIEYTGPGRIETKRERVFDGGYAIAFEELVAFVAGLLPTNEVMRRAIRSTVPMLPGLALREVLANALIHQDLTMPGTSPMVELFERRVEITNPGAPLVETDRFLDSRPQSRNERMASLMRRLGFCEERGSGIDKVVSQTELHQLPAPLFEAPGHFTKATLFGHKSLTEMSAADRIRAVYLHACLKYSLHESVSNASVRTRFGIEKKNSATASRLIREALDAGMIGRREETLGTRNRRYLPFWALPGPLDSALS